MANNIKVTSGTQAAYDGLQRKDSDTFYVCTDTHNLYFGAVLIFSEDLFKFLTVDSLNRVVITTYGLGGLTVVSFSDYSNLVNLLRAIRDAIQAAYRFIRVIVSRDITESLLLSSIPGDVYCVNFGFTVGSGQDEAPSSLFVDSVQEGDVYSDDTYIVTINTGTIESPVLKFDILNYSSVGGGGPVVKPDWTAVSGSSAEILNKPPVWSGTGTGSIVVGDSGNTASGDYSYAGGYNTVTQNTGEWASGISNVSHNNNTIYSVGIGDNTRKNAIEIMMNGDIYVYDMGNYDGSNYSLATRLQDIITQYTQSDWNQINSSAPDYIKNKPTIPQELEWESI